MSKSNQNLTLNQDLLDNYIKELSDNYKKAGKSLRIRDIYNKLDGKNPKLVRREYSSNAQIGHGAVGFNVDLGISYDNHGNPVEIYQTDEHGKTSNMTSEFQLNDEKHNNKEMVNELFKDISQKVASKTNEVPEIPQPQKKTKPTKVMPKEQRYTKHQTPELE